MELIEEGQSSEAAIDHAISCHNCGNLLTQSNQKSPLCPPCRELFIKYPIPVWIKAFGGGILLILLFSLFTLPKSINIGIHLKRGKEAAANHEYVTAQKEFSEVVKKEPAFIEAKCRLLIAAFYNNDFSTLLNASKALEGKDIKDKALFEEANIIMEKATAYFPTDSFNHFIEHYNTAPDSIPESVYTSFLSKNSGDDYARVQWASILFDHHEYAKADEQLNILLQKDPVYYYALSMKPALKREIGEYDSSLYYADKMFAVNQQSTYAYATKVKTLLKLKRDKEALLLAKKGYTIDPKDSYVLASLALAYHYSGDEKNRDAIIAKAEKDSAAFLTITPIKDIISGKEKFRN